MGLGLSAGAIAGIGAGVSAVGSVAGGLISGGAAQGAANTQAAAADQASEAAQAQFQQTRADEQPFMAAGTNALGALQSSLGLGGSGPNLLASNGLSGLTFQPTQAQLAATPGYQFDLAQGLQSTQNSNAAQGLGVSGAALKGAANYATGLANNTLTTQQGIFQQNLNNVLNPLQSLTNLGQNAATQTGQQGVQATSNANQLAVGGANAQAAGQVGGANALSSGIAGLGNSATSGILLSNLLNNQGAQPEFGSV